MALQSIYAVSLGGGEPEEVVNFVAGEWEDPSTDDARDYCLELVTQTIKQREWADRVITSKLEHWDLIRVTLIDKLILELAIVEMVNFDDVPLKVSISEAIEIAKRFSTNDSPGFINGILDAVYHDILGEKMEDGD